jgi:hypothetical protein
MSAKITEDYAMNAAVIDVRSRVKGLVEQAEIKTRSRMLAYERVGQMIGKSSGWVRGFIGNDDRYRVEYSTGLSIKAIYERTCLHIELGNEKMRAEHEAHQSNLGMHQATDSAALLPPNDY